MRPLLLCLLLGGAAGAQTLFDDYGVPGPFATAAFEIAPANPYAGSDPLPLRVDVPFGAGGPRPLVVFGHGSGAPPGVYDELLALFASWGFVVVSPGTWIAGPQAELASDMVAALKVVRDLSEDPESPLSGKVDAARWAAFGHSLGGGAAVLAAASEPELDAVVALAPWNVTAQDLPPADAAAALSVPLLVVVGGEDAVTPLETDAQPIYDAAVGAERLRELVVVPGAFHAGPQVLFDVAADAGVGLLRAHLLDEHPALDHVYGPFAQADPDREITFALAGTDCFVTGSATAGEVLDVHAAAPGGTTVWIAAGLAPAGAGTCLGVDLAAGLLAPLGATGPLQVATIGLSGDGLAGLPAGTVVLFQALAGPDDCSPVRVLTVP